MSKKQQPQPGGPDGGEGGGTGGGSGSGTHDGQRDGSSLTDGAPGGRAHERLFLDLAEQGLRRGLRVRFRALGGQMSPAISDGEWLTVEPIAPVSLREGDVVLALVEGELSPRRVLALRERLPLPGQEFAADVTLRGDARGSVIDVVPGERVLGRVVGVDRGGLIVSLEPPVERKPRGLGGLLVPIVIAAVAATAAAIIGVLPMVRGEGGAAATTLRGQGHK